MELAHFGAPRNKNSGDNGFPKNAPRIQRQGERFSCVSREIKIRWRAFLFRFLIFKKHRADAFVRFFIHWNKTRRASSKPRFLMSEIPLQADSWGQKNNGTLSPKNPRRSGNQTSYLAWQNLWKSDREFNVCFFALDYPRRKINDSCCYRFLETEWSTRARLGQLGHDEPASG